MNKRVQQFAASAFGVIFVSILLALSVFFPNPTSFQYTIFKTVLSLSAAGVAAMIPGFLQVSISAWLRAGGALAVFVVVYFYNPAQLLNPPSQTPPKTSPQPPQRTADEWQMEAQRIRPLVQMLHSLTSQRLSAQPPKEWERAETDYTAAENLYTKGEYEAACVQYKAAQKQYQDLQFAMNSIADPPQPDLPSIIKPCAPNWETCRGYKNLPGHWRGRFPGRSMMTMDVQPIKTERPPAKAGGFCAGRRGLKVHPLLRPAL